MDTDKTLEEVLRKQLVKWRTDLMIIDLWGEIGAPLSRKELEKLIQESERELEKLDKGNVARANSRTD